MYDQKLRSEKGLSLTDTVNIESKSMKCVLVLDIEEKVFFSELTLIHESLVWKNIAQLHFPAI